jgi:NodT family efflux transporter outer membrane factor (OMF) lipoprotein
MNPKALVVICSAALVLSACKNPQPPPTPVPPAPGGGYGSYGTVPPQTSSIDAPAETAQRFLAGMDVPGQWWTLFHSTELNTIIDQALAANPDITAAQAALRNARETYEAQRASAAPNAQASFGVSRQQTPTFYSPPLSSGSEYIYGVHTASVDVSYTPDVFGNLRYQTANAAAAAEVQRFQVEETYLSLTSNVVATVVQIASLRGQIDTTNRVIAIDRQLLDLTISQRKYGQLSGLDEATQEAALRAAEQTLPPLQKQLVQSQDLLARLAGKSPSEGPAMNFDLTSLHLPGDLPLSLPSQLITQRPDIAATTANLKEEGAAVGVAYTNRLPNFSITAQTATQALSVGGLFGAGSLLSMLTGQVAETFYDHGTLKHREAAAVAAYDEAAAQYLGAVLSGFQNVADTLAALSSDADALNAAVLADRSAEHALEITRSQQRLGQVSTPVILDAEQSFQQAELSLVQAQASRYSDTAALFAALGGGWWNRSDTPSGN